MVSFYAPAKPNRQYDKVVKLEIEFDIYRLKVSLLADGQWTITSSQYLETDGRLVSMAPGERQQLWKFHFSQIDELVRAGIEGRSKADREC